MYSNKASLALGFGIMGTSAWAIASAVHWPLKAALFPLVVGIPLFCLAATEVVCILFFRSGTSPRSNSQAMGIQTSEQMPESVDLPRTLVAIGWILGFFAAIVLLGFLIAVPLFVFLYVKMQGQESWGLSVIFTFAVWAIFYGLFGRVLHLPFPDGWLQTWLGMV